MPKKPDLEKILNSLDVKNLLDHQTIFEELGIGPQALPKPKKISSEEEARMSLDEKCHALQKVQRSVTDRFSKFGKTVRAVSFEDNAKVYTQILDAAEKTAHSWLDGLKLKKNFVEMFPAGDLISMLHYAGEHLEFQGCFFDENFFADPFNVYPEKCVYVNLDAKTLAGKYLHIPKNQISEYITGDDKHPPPPQASELAALSSRFIQPQGQPLWARSIISTTTTLQVPTAETFESAKLTPVSQSEINEFKNRLVNERALLFKKIKAENPDSLNPDYYSYEQPDVSLLRAMDRVLKNIDHIKIYEAFTTPINGIPAIYRADTKTIYVSVGNLNFNLWFHEMGHTTQTSGLRVFQNSHNHIKRFDASNVSNAEEYLIREEEDYQWNVTYTLFKAGYGRKELFDLQDSLRELADISPDVFESRRMRADHEDVRPNIPTDDLCALASGAHPKAYERVLELFQKIEKIADFSDEERSTALQLVGAYFDIVISPQGKITIEEGQMQKLLGDFYYPHLTKTSEINNPGHK